MNLNLQLMRKRLITRGLDFRSRSEFSEAGGAPNIGSRCIREAKGSKNKKSSVPPQKQMSCPLNYALWASKSFGSRSVSFSGKTFGSFGSRETGSCFLKQR